MSVAHHKPIVAIHRNDPEWIIALWLAIHGGDPAPHLSAQATERAATDAIRALSAHLGAAQAKAVNAALGH